jgi:hypothetical protein
LETSNPHFSHDFDGWEAKSSKGMREGDGGDRARLKGELGVKRRFSPRSKPLYTFKTRSLRVRSGLSGNPGVSGLDPGYSTPPELSEQIFKEFDLEWIWKVAYVIYVSLSSINTLD